MKDILIYIVIAVICGIIYASVTEVSIRRAFFETVFMFSFWGGVYILAHFSQKRKSDTRGPKEDEQK
jgi:hypothetical protein